jgi:hypothetical protein
MLHVIFVTAMTIDDFHLPFFIQRIISLIPEEDGKKAFSLKEAKMY